MFKVLPILLLVISFSEVSFARSVSIQCDGYNQKMKIELAGDERLEQAQVTLLRSRPKKFEQKVEQFSASFSGSPLGYGQERNVQFNEDLNIPADAPALSLYQYDGYELVLPRYVIESQKLNKRVFRIELNSSDDRYFRGLVGLFSCRVQN